MSEVKEKEYMRNTDLFDDKIKDVKNIESLFSKLFASISVKINSRLVVWNRDLEKAEIEIKKKISKAEIGWKFDISM